MKWESRNDFVTWERWIGFCPFFFSRRFLVKLSTWVKRYEQILYLLLVFCLFLVGYDMYITVLPPNQKRRIIRSSTPARKMFEASKVRFFGLFLYKKTASSKSNIGSNNQEDRSCLKELEPMTSRNLYEIRGFVESHELKWICLYTMFATFTCVHELV